MNSLPVQVLGEAADAGSWLLLSEDLHDGFTWSGVTVVNPFAAAPHHMLSGVVEDPQTQGRDDPTARFAIRLRQRRRIHDTIYRRVATTY